MFVYYKLKPEDALRIAESIRAHISAGSSEIDAVYLGLQEVDKIFDREIAKHKKNFLKQVEFLLVKQFCVDKEREYDMMEEFYPKSPEIEKKECVPITAELLNHTHKE